jgi:PKD repeat protein
MKKYILYIIITIVASSCNKDGLDWELPRKNKLDSLCNENPVDANLPVAKFYASSRSIEIGSTVNFSNNSIKNPFTFMWSFPGGSPTSSFKTNEDVVYQSIGKYPVSLKVENNFGIDSTLKNDYIEAYYFKSFSNANWGGWTNNGWTFSNSGNILAWQNSSTTPISCAITRNFTNISLNPKLDFFYNIYSPGGTLKVKVNNIEIWSNTGYSSNTVSIQLPGVSFFTLKFEALVGYTQSIYLNNITIKP